ncbi:MAG: 2-oxo acid dehydrogenase subunit E2 [Treponema sp.]|nr:2-oxo acid dehydrogenase subunit E2 [Treponema sp.]
MASILIMPRQGNTVESCIIVNWKVKEGEQVTSETIVCEVETDKATFEIPAGAEGTILKILHDEGDDVPVLSPIAVIGSPGENWQELLVENSLDYTSRKGAETQNSLQEKSHGDTETQRTRRNIEDFSLLRASVPPCDINSNKGISPRAKNLAVKEALSIDTLAGSGPEGRIIERDVKNSLENRPALTAAAKTAGAGNFPQQGTGLNGKITLQDITETPNTQLFSSDDYTETPIKGVRKVISDRMIKSLAETAQFTLNASANVSKLQDIRAKMKASESKITVNDLILFAVSRTLPNFLYMNAHKTGDIIKTFNKIHLGSAVDTSKGLMVPVIRNINLLTLTEISTESKRLASSCQNNSIKPDELSGSTFTVTNLGSLGITNFTPVLNIPEIAILGVCGIEMKPVTSELNNNCCNFEPHIGFSLTINHQVVDGAPAARFLKALCDAVTNIDQLIVEG